MAKYEFFLNTIENCLIQKFRNFSARRHICKCIETILISAAQYNYVILFCVRCMKKYFPSIYSVVK